MTQNNKSTHKKPDAYALFETRTNRESQSKKWGSRKEGKKLIHDVHVMARTDFFLILFFLFVLLLLTFSSIMKINEDT